jgi:hypothetical protein
MGFIPVEWLSQTHLTAIASILPSFMTPIDGGVAVVVSVIVSKFIYFLMKKMKVNEDARFIASLMFGTMFGFLASAGLIVNKVLMVPSSSEEFIRGLGSPFFAAPVTLFIIYFSHFKNDKTLSGLVYGFMVAGVISMLSGGYFQTGLFTISSALFSWMILGFLTAVNNGKKERSFHAISVVFGVLFGAGVNLIVNLGPVGEGIDGFSMISLSIFLLTGVLTAFGMAPSGFNTVFKLQ